MGFPGPEHILFIPGVLLIGVVLGYVMGQRTARDAADRKKKRSRE